MFAKCDERIYVETRSEIVQKMYKCNKKERK